MKKVKPQRLLDTLREINKELRETVKLWKELSDDEGSMTSAEENAVLEDLAQVQNNLQDIAKE